MLFPMEGDSTPESAARKQVQRRDEGKRLGRTRRTTADFEQVVVSDAHHFFATVDDDGGFFDDAARADDDGPSESKDGRLGMDNGAGSDGDVAFEIDILTNDRFRMDRKLVPTEMINVS